MGGSGDQRSRSERVHGLTRVRGRARLGYQWPGEPPCWPSPRRQNLVGYDWGSTVAMALRGAPDGKRYYLNGMYFEFDNSGAPVTAPSYDRDGATSYYSNLNSAYPTRDYLRVPIVSSAGEKSDEDLFTLNNIAVFHARTAGTTGVHGLPFSDAANSRVYGLGLVNFRDPANPSLDLIFSRLYFSASEQLEKLASGQIVGDWELTFD